MFELRQLRCFVAVAEELHFGRAALRLHMTQPPLSRQVQLLEHHLNAQLLERNNRNVKLTSAGRHFVREAQMILRLAESASLSVRRIARGDAGTVTVGFTASSGYRFMPGMIARCRERLPNVALTLKEMVTMEQLEAISSGRLDLALLRPHAPNDDLDSLCVAREPLVAALPASHALAQGRLPMLSDFDRAPFVMYTPLEARYFHDLVADTFSHAGVRPEYTQYTSQIHSMLALVRAGLGVALVPEAATHLRFDGVVFRQVRKSRAAHLVELYLTWKRESDNPARKSVLDTCLEFCRASIAS
jgi:DNA-binding transcriptional LysR family regulator